MSKAVLFLFISLTLFANFVMAKEISQGKDRSEATKMNLNDALETRREIFRVLGMRLSAKLGFTDLAPSVEPSLTPPSPASSPSPAPRNLHSQPSHYDYYGTPYLMHYGAGYCDYDGCPPCTGGCRQDSDCHGYGNEAEVYGTAYGEAYISCRYRPDMVGLEGCASDGPENLWDDDNYWTPEDTGDAYYCILSYDYDDYTIFEDEFIMEALFFVAVSYGACMCFYLCCRFRCACDGKRHNVKVAPAKATLAGGLSKADPNTVLEGSKYVAVSHPPGSSVIITTSLLLLSIIVLAEPILIIVSYCPIICFIPFVQVPVVGIIAYVISLEVCRRSSIYHSFQHSLKSDKLEEYLTKIHEERVKINCQVVCSHTESHTTTDSEGNSRTETRTVVTFNHTFQMPYGECQSGEKNPRSVRKGRYNYVFCKTIPVISLKGGTEAEKLVNKFTKRMYEENKHRDTSCTTTQSYVIEALEPMQLVKYKSSCMMSKLTFELFAVFWASWAYIIWLSGSAGQCEIRCHKVLKNLETDESKWSSSQQVPNNAAMLAGLMKAAAGGAPQQGQQGIQMQAMNSGGGQYGQPTGDMANALMSQSMSQMTPQQMQQQMQQQQMTMMQMQQMMMQQGGAGEAQGIMMPAMGQPGMQMQPGGMMQPNGIMQAVDMPLFTVPLVPTVTVRVPIYGGGGSVTAEYKGKMFMAEIPNDATPGAEITVPVPEGYR